MSETEDYRESITCAAHHTSHEESGSDEIDCTGLTGQLADEQDAGKIKGLSVPAPGADDDEKALTYEHTPPGWKFTASGGGSHATTHEDEGSDEISLAGLAGKSAELVALEATLTDTINSLLPAQKSSNTGAARLGGIAAVVGGKIYAGLGKNGANNKKWWEYDPAEDYWTQKTDFGGTARYFAVAAVVGGKIYAGLGNDGGRRKDWWEYDPAGNSWTQKTDFPGAARESGVAVVIDDKIYAGLGWDGAARYKDVWEYNPVGNSWTRSKDFGGEGRNAAVAVAVAGRIYSGFGYNGTNLSDFWYQILKA